VVYRRGTRRLSTAALCSRLMPLLVTTFFAANDILEARHDDPAARTWRLVSLDARDVVETLRHL